MEQETKNKTKRALAIAGIGTLSAFALIGVFAVGSLIGGCASANKAPEEVYSSTKEERRALAAVDGDVGEPVDLLEGAFLYHFSWATPNDSYVSISYAGDVKEAFLDLSAGYYRISFDVCAGVFACSSQFKNAAMFYTSPTSSVATIDISFNPSTEYWVNDGLSGHVDYLYLPAGSYLFYTLYHLTVELVNTIQVPASEILNLGEDWNPTAWVSREAIGGYPVIHTTYATEANASAAYVLVGWEDVIFKTAADSAVFTGLRVRYRWLWSGAKYLYNGQNYTYSWPSGSGNYWLWPNAVEYRDMAGNWSVVASANQDWDGSNYIVTTRFNWVLPTYRTLGFIKHPETPDHLSIRRYFNGDLSTSEDDWVLSPILHGVSFAEWFGLASWDSPANDVGAGNAIGLISTAFTGMVPILGISIFPNITLGLLLFLPLIGGIIVLIIKAVSK